MRVSRTISPRVIVSGIPRTITKPRTRTTRIIGERSCPSVGNHWDRAAQAAARAVAQVGDFGQRQVFGKPVASFEDLTALIAENVAGDIHGVTDRVAARNDEIDHGGERHELAYRVERDVLSEEEEELRLLRHRLPQCSVGERLDFNDALSFSIYCLDKRTN